MRTLIIAEDQIFARKLQISLKQIPLNVDWTTKKEQGQYWAKTTDYDLIIAEHSASCDAIIICKELRDHGKDCLMMVVTESLSSDDAVTLFNYGVDDYISKFNTISEICARIKAMLRRPRNRIGETFTLGDLIVDCNTYTVSRNGQTVNLTKKEFTLLQYLLRHQDRVLSRTDIIEHVWDINADLFSNSLETHILNLRKKLDQPGKPKLIHTISGRGYRITAPA